MNIEIANAYVGTNDVSGQCQLDILKVCGLKPEHHLLEIGCGCLNGGRKIIEYLEPNHYVGIDPNSWLLETAINSGTVGKLIADKGARFMTRDDFDARLAGQQFDFTFSHSVLSHAASWQLARYFAACRMVAHSKTVGLASIRLAEGNCYGSAGSHDRKDSLDFDWQYPGNSWFTFDTIKSVARIYGFAVSVMDELTEYYVKNSPLECHDWISFFVPVR